MLSSLSAEMDGSLQILQSVGSFFVGLVLLVERCFVFVVTANIQGF